MFFGRICRNSGSTPHPIEPERALDPRVKYCLRCRKVVKKKQTKESRPYEDRKEYLGERHAEFRKRNPGYSTKYVRAHRERLKARVQKVA